MRHRGLHYVIVTLALFGFWVVLSGKMDAFHLTLGAVSSVFVAVLSGGQLYGRTRDGGKRWLSMIPWQRFVLYVPWLFWEIVKANIQVLKLVFGPNANLSPRIVCIEPDLRQELSQVVLGNSITLTPGTVTLDLTDDGHYLVHAIDEASAAGLTEGTMQRKVAWAFKDEGSGA